MAEPPAPDELVITDGERRLTRPEWDRRAGALARGLAMDHGIAAGDRVAVKMANRTEYFEVTSGLSKLGATAVPVGYRLTPHEVAQIVEDSEARLLITDDARLDGVQLGADYEALLAAHDDGPPTGSQATAPAESIVYTSGTTGRPRGAVRRFDPEKLTALGALLGSMASKLRLDAGGVHLMTCPNYHAAPPFYASFTLANAGRVVVQQRFDPEGALALIAAERVTTTFMVPTMLNRIAALPPEVSGSYDLSSLRAVIAGGAPFPAPLKRRVVDLLGDDVLFDVYGSTETGNVTVLDPADHARKPGSVGRPFDGVQVRILDEAGAEMPPGEPGEIYVASPLLVDGYHGDPEDAAESRRDGYLTVGDVGYLDDEGYLHVVDRAKDMIVAGGANVYPAEVEAVLREHPGVFDVAVIGVPDDDLGERVHAVLEERADAAVGDGELLGLCRERLAKYKWPRSFARVVELPRTPFGKVLKRELRAEHWESEGRTI